MSKAKNKDRKRRAQERRDAESKLFKWLEQPDDLSEFNEADLDLYNRLAPEMNAVQRKWLVSSIRGNKVIAEINIRKILDYSQRTGEPNAVSARPETAKNVVLELTLDYDPLFGVLTAFDNSGNELVFINYNLRSGRENANAANDLYQYINQQETREGRGVLRFTLDRFPCTIIEDEETIFKVTGIPKKDNTLYVLDQVIVKGLPRSPFRMCLKELKAQDRIREEYRNGKEQDFQVSC